MKEGRNARKVLTASQKKSLPGELSRREEEAIEARSTKIATGDSSRSFLSDFMMQPKYINVKVGG